MTQDTQLPTPAERDFCFHYYQEELNHTYQGSAHKWVNEHGISNGSMIAFGYWEQRNNPQWLNQLLEDEPLPSRFLGQLKKNSSRGCDYSWSSIRR